MNEKIYEWISTFVLLVGVFLTSINYFPLNIYISLIGNIMWFVLGILWKKWSLIIIQIIISALYIFGIIKNLIFN
jgi:hypothetical protein